MLARLLVVVLVIAVAGPAARADDASSDYVVYPERPVVTDHTLDLNGRTLHYRATAGTLPLVNDERAETARMFFVAYRLTDGPPAQPAPAEDGASSDPGEVTYPDPSTRPITFCFNGGPGSSSVWLHLGGFGPRRVDFADDMGQPGPPPFRLVDNEGTLLDRTDLVFIDPVSTGFSRPEGETRASTFHGVEPDIASVAEFIRRYLGHEQRWGSPKYIAGESYGTTRAAGLARVLWRSHGIALNGVILVSAILDFQTARFAPGNDLPYVLFLPTCTATAHYHRALNAADQARPIEELLAEVEAFAIGEYGDALRRGDTLDDARRKVIIEKLARYTGLDPLFIERRRMRVSMGAFAKELLRTRSRIVGRLDSRFTGIDLDDAGTSYGFDPSYEAIRGNFTACLNQYLRGELGFKSDLPYEILTGLRWEYGNAANNRFLNVAERLRQTMHEQPFMKVFLASGIYDFATPHFAAEWTFDHVGLAPEFQANVDRKRYRAGHMMYIDAAERLKLKADLDEFYGRSDGS